LATAGKSVPAAPLLEGGDRFSRDEFERRYRAMPGLKKAELIEGVVYLPSPVSFEKHAELHAFLMTWLGLYRAATPGVRLGDNGTVRLDLDNEVQPDAFLFIEKGGRAVVGADGYVEGAPEFIAEIASSSASYDLHDKLRAYRRNGVREYLVWRVLDGQLDWFELQGTEYVERQPDAAGVISSRVFPGLRLAVRALLEGDPAKVLAELRVGLEGADHQAFAGTPDAAADDD